MNVSASPSGQVVSALTHMNTHTLWVRDAWPYVRTQPAGVNGRTHLNIVDTCMQACVWTDIATMAMVK